MPAAWPAAGASRLGAALTALAPRLESGDRLLVVGDGRATDALPAPGALPGIRIDWRQPPLRPRIGWVDAPAAWPPGGAAVLRVQLVDADLDAGQLEIEADAAGVRAGEPRRVDDQTFEILVESAAAASCGLRLRWRQGDSQTAYRLRILAPGRLALAEDRPELRAAFAIPDVDLVAGEVARVHLLPADRLDAAAHSGIAAKLARGDVVVLAAGSVEGWLELPAELRLLRPVPPPQGVLWVLLDRSGSTAAEDGLETAKAALRDWAEAWPAEAALRVLPFAEAAGAVAGTSFDPRTPQGAQQLARLFPSGPTELAPVLATLEPALAPGAALLIWSDGRTPAPAEGWAALADRLHARGARTLAVPLGPDPDDRVLAAFGLAAANPDRALRTRLLAALAGAWPAGATPLRPAEGAQWSLPNEVAAPGSMPRLGAAPGAEALLEDAGGAVALAARRVGTGLLVGVAAPPTPEWGAAVRSLAVEHLQAPRLLRTGGRLELRGPGEGWSARRAGGAWQPFDPIGPGRWQVQGLPAGAVLEVQPGRGPGFTLTPAIAEDRATAAAWRNWLAERPVEEPRRLRRGVLLAAVLLAVAAAGWAAYRAPTG